MGESFPGKAFLQNMVETKSLSSNPVNKKTSEGERGFLGQHCSGRAVEPPLPSPARPVAQVYRRVPSAFRGSRSCAAMAAVCLGSVTVSCLSVCFRVAGATINLDFTPDFDLQKYRDRLVQGLLSQVHEPAGLGGTKETTSHWPRLPVPRCWWGCLGGACGPSDAGRSASLPTSPQGSPPSFGLLDEPTCHGGWHSLPCSPPQPRCPSQCRAGTAADMQMGKDAGGLAGNPGLENTGGQL